MVDKLLKLDNQFTRFTSRIIPYSVDQIWTHLTKSYFDFQSFLHASQGTASPVRLVPGSPEGVGAAIEFDWNGSPVRETLVVQDDQTYVWRIIVPGETAVFKRYNATLSLIPMTDTVSPSGQTLATLQLEMILQDPSLASSVFPAIDQLILERLPRLEEFIQLQQGYFTLVYAEDVTVPTDKLWSIVSNWNDISWVLGAQSVHVDTKDPYLREIDLAGGFSISERLVAKNDDTRTLTYQMLSSSFPVSYYRANLTLAPAAKGKTAFEYRLLFIPKGVTAPQAGKLILDRLKAGVHFISSNLGTKSAT